MSSLGLDLPLLTLNPAKAGQSWVSPHRAEFQVATAIALNQPESPTKHPVSGNQPATKPSNQPDQRRSRQGTQWRSRRSFRCLPHPAATGTPISGQLATYENSSQTNPATAIALNQPAPPTKHLVSGQPAAAITYPAKNSMRFMAGLPLSSSLNWLMVSISTNDIGLTP